MVAVSVSVSVWMIPRGVCCVWTFGHMHYRESVLDREEWSTTSNTHSTQLQTTTHINNKNWLLLNIDHKQNDLLYSCTTLPMAMCASWCILLYENSLVVAVDVVVRCCHLCCNVHAGVSHNAGKHTECCTSTCAFKWTHTRVSAISSTPRSAARYLLLLFFVFLILHIGI